MAKSETENFRDYMERIAAVLTMEDDNLVDSFPSIKAVVEFFELFDVYDTDLFTGIQEAIAEGADVKPLAEFIVRNNLEKEWDAPLISQNWPTSQQVALQQQLDVLCQLRKERAFG